MAEPNELNYYLVVEITTIQGPVRAYPQECNYDADCLNCQILDLPEQTSEPDGDNPCDEVSDYPDPDPDSGTCIPCGDPLGNDPCSPFSPTIPCWFTRRYQFGRCPPYTTGPSLCGVAWSNLCRQNCGKRCFGCAPGTCTEDDDNPILPSLNVNYATIELPPGWEIVRKRCIYVTAGESCGCY